MSNIAFIREIFNRALEELESAEKVYQETIDELSMRTQGVRQQTVRLDDDIEHTIFGLRSRTETAWARSERILGELGLHRAQPSTFNIPANLQIQPALDHMGALTSMCEETRQELEIVAQKLRDERKKWWKFW